MHTHAQSHTHTFILFSDPADMIIENQSPLTKFISVPKVNDPRARRAPRPTHSHIHSTHFTHTLSTAARAQHTLYTYNTHAQQHVIYL